MKKLLLFIVLSSMSIATMVAQESYSNDVTCVSADEKIVVMRASGIHEKKKLAADMAVKSAFNALLITGVDGVNNGKPLVATPNERYLEGFMTGRYRLFMRGFQESGEPEKQATKDYKSTVTVEILISPLIKDLVRNKLMVTPNDKISMEETQEQLQLPSIMVVPYKKEGLSYATILSNDFDRRMAVSKVQEGFNQRGVTTIDIEARLNATLRSSEFEANNADSNDKQLLMSSGADVYVVVDLMKDISAQQGSRVSLVLKAYETASGNILGTRQGWTNRFNTTALDRLCVYAVKDQLDGFLNDVATNFAKKITQGNSIVLRIALADGSIQTMNSKVGSANTALSAAIRNWVRKNAQGGRYHIQGIVDESMVFDNVQIPPKDADGLPIDAAQFGDNLSLYLNEELGVPCESRLDGNTVYITIQ